MNESSESPITAVEPPQDSQPTSSPRRKFQIRERRQVGLSSSELINLRRTRKLRQRAETAEAKAMFDGLTQLHNKPWFEDELNRRYSEAIRQRKGLWVIYMDIDRFKKVNDKYGHPTGDEVLKAFGEIGNREEEPFSRIGGEEFAQILQDGFTLEDLEKIVSRYSFSFREKTMGILGREATMSFGIARLGVGDTPVTLKSRADRALYYSKRNGRNRATLIDLPGEQGEVISPIKLLSREELRLREPIQK